MRPVEAAVPFVQVADITKGKFTHEYQSVMSLLVVDFKMLEGRNGELVVKDLAACRLPVTLTCLQETVLL